MANNNIKVSLHGSVIGLDFSNNLVIDGRRAVNNRGATNVAPRVELIDDFLGDVIADQWDAKTGSDGSVVTPTINVQANGAVRLTTGAGATTTMAVNGVQLQGSLNFFANKDNLVFECRLKAAAVTSVAIFVGLTDQVSSLEMPVNGSGSGNGITTTATDAVGFVFDTTMTDASFWCTGVANDVDGTHVTSSVAPVAATYNYLRIEIDSSGNATFYIDGSRVGYVASAVTITVGLTPCVAIFRRSASSTTLDVDYIRIAQDR